MKSYIYLAIIVFIVAGCSPNSSERLKEIGESCSDHEECLIEWCNPIGGAVCKDPRRLEDGYLDGDCVNGGCLDPSFVCVDGRRCIAPCDVFGEDRMCGAAGQPCDYGGGCLIGEGRCDPQTNRCVRESRSDAGLTVDVEPEYPDVVIPPDIEN